MSRLPLILILLGGLFRFAYAWHMTPIMELWSDMKVYNDLAQLLKQGVWSSAHFFQSIGYPLFLALMQKTFPDWGKSVAFFQAFLSTLSLYFFYRFTLEEFGRKTALISLTIGVVHLPWIFYPGLVLPETIFTFLLSAGACLGLKIVRSSGPQVTASLLWGLLFIVAFWLKGTHVFWAPLFLLGIFLLKRSLKPVICITSMLLLGLLGHGTLSYVKTDRFQLSAATGGLNLVEGKCPSKLNIDSTETYWLSPLYLQLGLTEKKQWPKPFTDSAYFFKQGLKCIQKNPLVLVQSLEAIPYLFFGNTMWPFYEMKVATPARFMELVFSIFLIGGLVLYARSLLVSPLDFSQLVIWLAPIFGLFICVYIFKSELRYRAPFDVWFIPLAVVGWRNFTSVKNPSAL